MDREAAIRQGMNILTSIDGLGGTTISQVQLLDKIALALVAQYEAGYTAGVVGISDARQEAHDEGFIDGYRRGYTDSENGTEPQVPLSE